MAYKNLPEERKIMTFLEDFVREDTPYEAFITDIRTAGLTEELVNSIREQLTKADGAEGENTPLKDVTAFNNLVNQWRLSAQKKNFRRQ